jgi:hypothetical protein
MLKVSMLKESAEAASVGLVIPVATTTVTSRGQDLAVG